MNRLTQCGTTMISLLVGMMVSMLAILASLSMFHDLVQTSAEAKTDARQDGDLSLAVLRLDQELLAAGFNMERALGDDRNLDFFVPNNIEAAPSVPARSRIVWRFYDGAKYTCRRVESKLDALQYSLTLYEAKDPCKDLDLKANIDNETKWIEVELMASIRLQSLDANLPVTQKKVLVLFESSPADGECTPFRVLEKSLRHPILTLKVYDTAAVYAGSEARTHSICLFNISLLSP